MALELDESDSDDEDDDFDDEDDDDDDDDVETPPVKKQQPLTKGLFLHLLFPVIKSER